MDCDIGLVIQARMGSTRLPNKVLLDLCGKPLLSYIIKGLTSLKKEYKIIVITSNLQKDNVIEEFCLENNILCFRGSENDVLDRYYQAARKYKLEHIVRLTGDNPIIDTENLNYLIEEHLKQNADYSSNKSDVGSGLPEGVGAEIFTFFALEKSWKEGKKENHREHVDEYILENQDEFKVLFVKAKKELENCRDLRLTIDTQADFDFVEKIINLLHKNNLQINLKNICRLQKNGDLV